MGNFFSNHISKILFIVFMTYLLTDIYQSLGETREAYVVGWDLFIAGILFPVTMYFLGYQSAKENRR